MAQIASTELCSIAHIPVLGSQRSSINVWNRHSRIQTGGISHTHIGKAKVAEHRVGIHQDIGLQGICTAKVGGNHELRIIASGIGIGIGRAGVGAAVSITKAPEVLTNGGTVGVGYGAGLGKIAEVSKTNAVGVYGSNNRVWVHQYGIGNYHGAVLIGLYGKLHNIAAGLGVELCRIQGVALVSVAKVPSEAGDLGIVNVGQGGALGKLAKLPQAHIGKLD